MAVLTGPPEDFIYQLMGVFTVPELSGRAYHQRAPQEPTYPMAVFRRVDSGRPILSVGTAGSVMTTFEITVYSIVSGTEAQSIGSTIRGVLDGLRITNGATATGQAVDLTGPEVMDFEYFGDGSEEIVFTCEQNYTVWSNE